MESEEKENIEQNPDELTVDLSKRSLKKIERANSEQKAAVSLILDRNELQRLDNIESYTSLKRLSLSSNRLIRMEGVSCMINLTALDMSNNSLVCIEGLKDLKQLKHLNLAGNKIKTIDHLGCNLELEYLDLSQNIIGHISDISFLHNLKELFLHSNEIAHLRQCEKNLPSGLETLTLNNNCITDLNEISHLVLLRSLKELSFSNNPCLEFTDSRIDFNYRPFVKNWCSSIVALDGYPLDDIECLKAEWLYSQGRGRSFRPGEHMALAKYLTSVCPQTTEPNMGSEDEKKLRLILSKAQHHQQQLKEQLTGNSTSPGRNKLPLNRKKASMMGERMASSYHDASAKDGARNLPELMSRSLDGVLLRNSSTPRSDLSESYQSPLQTATTLLPVPESLTSPDVCRSLHQFPTSGSNAKMSFPLATSYSCRSPLSTAKNPHIANLEGKMKANNILRRQNNNSSPIPSRKCDRIMSPSKSRSTPIKGGTAKKKTSSATTAMIRKAQANGRDSSEEEEDDSEFSESMLQKFPKQKKQESGKRDGFGKKNGKDAETDVWKAALCIQRHWRGYRTRNLNRDVVEAYKNIQSNRIQDYIIKVANDMEAAKAALEGHRKLQVLQMQAINALWRKIVNLQPGDMGLTENKNMLQGLSETCLNLNRQVEELHIMMKAMRRGSGDANQSIPTSTQTEIVAVHTPQGEERQTFPYCPRVERPSLLKVNEHGAEGMEPLEAGAISNALRNASVDSNGTSEQQETPPDNPANRTSSLSEKEDSVCLTPACQEGKDLQSMIEASQGRKDVPKDEKQELEEEEVGAAAAIAPTIPNPSPEPYTSPFNVSWRQGSNDNKQNGCPSS